MQNDPYHITVEQLEDMLIRWLRSNGAPELPPEWSVSEMDSDRSPWGLFKNDEHTISFETRAMAVDSAWANWISDIGQEWLAWFIQTLALKLRD